jgi:hypothetical protein
MQPFMSEFKLNEQVIRGKLQAGHQRNAQVQIKNQVMQDSQSSQSKQDYQSTYQSAHDQ